MTSATGDQTIRSLALGVMLFSTRLNAEKVTATYTSRRDARRHFGKAMPARAKITNASKARTTACTTAATRNSGGN